MNVDVDDNLSLSENGPNNNNKEQPSLQDEIIDIHESEGSDIEIVAVSKSVAEGRTKNKLKEFIRSRRRTKIYVNSVNSNNGRNQASYIKEEIIISDASESDDDNPSQLKTLNRQIDRCHFKDLQSTPKKKVPNRNESLSSIILNCPRCNITKTVFSTTLGNIICKECNVNMSYVCNKCNLRYPTMIALYRHKKLQCESIVKTKSLQPKSMFILKCSKCNLSQKIRQINKTSRCLTCRIEMPYECVVCSKTFNTYSNLYSHLRNRCQIKYRTYYCNECNFRCTNELTLLRHLNKTHPEIFVFDKTVKCCVCDQIFENQVKFKEHETKCGLSLYKCKFCSYKPKYQENLHKHVISRHTDKICDTSIQDILKQSVITLETDENKKKTTVKPPKIRMKPKEITKKIKKIVYCPKCDKESPYRKGFRFCSTCSSNYRYKCSECKGVYQGLPSLYRHIHRQHGNMDHECETCGRAFSFFGDYNEHAKTCGKEPRFACKICFFKTRYKYNLRNHMYKLHDENRQTLMCEDCGAEYKTQRTMSKHLEKCKKRIIRMTEMGDIAM